MSGFCTLPELFGCTKQFWSIIFHFLRFLAHNVNFATKIQTSTFLLPFFWFFYEVMIEHFSMQFAQFLYTSRSRVRILSFLKMRAFLSRNIIHRRCMSNTFVRFFLKPNSESNLEDAWFSVFSPLASQKNFLVKSSSM